MGGTRYKQASSRNRSSKKRTRNQYSHKSSETISTPPPTTTKSSKNRSASAAKLNVPRDNDDDPSKFNFIMKSSILISLIERIGMCPDCGQHIKCKHRVAERFGLNHYFKLCCTNKICEWEETVSTSTPISRQQSKDNRGRHGYAINQQIIVVFREVGEGYQAMETFCGIMNMSAPMSESTFHEKNPEIYNAYVATAHESMKSAAHEHKERDIAVSVDGTWQRRGHWSLNGAVALISQETGKCLDVEVMSKSCTACKIWARRK